MKTKKFRKIKTAKRILPFGLINMYSGIPSVLSFKHVLTEIRKKIIVIYASAERNIFTKKDDSPVTAADLYSEKRLLTFLKKTHIPVISEEQKNTVTDSEYVWYVDPLDGTQDFINQTGEFSIMIGLAQKTRPVFGIVYKPITDELFFASRGEGAFKIKENKKSKLFVNKTNILSKASAVVSRSHFLQTDEDILKKCGVTKMIPCGSIGVKIGLLAEGKADIYFNTSDKTSLWDTCAPQIILEEAGGKIATLQGKEIIYKTNSLRNKTGIIASNALLYEDILVKISK